MRAVVVPGHAREQEDSERSRFARFAKKLVQVPKEINEKAEEWKRERKRGGSNEKLLRNDPRSDPPAC